ncbi:MAG: hypothetical protein VZS44_02175 [Bacilli bacterium]|nr:hypothetical protein [Bacilli bacterium]
MLVVELGFKLNKDIKYYENILNKSGAVNRFNCKTHDIYWTNKNLDNMTENEMKNSCIRLRITEGFGGVDFSGKSNKSYRFQNVDNFVVTKNNQKELNLNEVNEYILKIESKGYKRVIDTKKVDYQYSIGNMKSRIQLQDISDVGLLLYYDNPDYYELPLDEQRNKLIDELNSYGFDFSYDTLGLDKLRTLYYKKEMFSKNQNG